MEKEVLYKKVYIEGKEENLPKDVGDYHVKFINDTGGIRHFPFYGDVGYNISKFDWLDLIDYWLKPVELPDDDEIKKASELEIDPGVIDDFQTGKSFTALRRRMWNYGANWFKSQILNK